MVSQPWDPESAPLPLEHVTSGKWGSNSTSSTDGLVSFGEVICDKVRDLDESKSLLPQLGSGDLLGRFLGSFSSVLKLPDRQICVVTDHETLQKVRTVQPGSGLPPQVMNNTSTCEQVYGGYLAG